MKLANKLLLTAIALMVIPSIMNAQCPGKCSGECVVEKAGAFVKSVPENDMYLISPDKIAEMIKSDKTDFIVLDIRPAKYYEAGHIKGSMNIPLPTLVDNLKTVPKDKMVAVVCTIDTNSAFAVAVLQMSGYNAWVVEGGIPGWEKSGRPLVK